MFLSIVDKQWRLRFVKDKEQSIFSGKKILAIHKGDSHLCYP